MISTQYGCAVGCRICDAGLAGYGGNIEADLLLAQIRAALASHPELDPARVPKLKVHFARMGEPSFNPGVLGCLASLARDGVGKGPFPGLLPSISTVAPACSVSRDFMEGLAKVKEDSFGNGSFQLQFSLHSTEEEARRAIIPIRTWSFQEIARYGERWFRPGDRLISLNFALADGIPFDPAVLSREFSPERFLVKFTPVNPTSRADKNGLTRVWLEAPEQIARFKEDLERRGFRAIVNPAWPEEIEGRVTCGQLVAAAAQHKYQGAAAPSASGLEPSAATRRKPQGAAVPA
jgi:23S rRNA (adenine2503-C2)-methyltransferase